MKALVYNGPRDVRVKNVADAKIERPTDVLVKVTSTNICGSDLHMYEGRTGMEEGRILGHENLGQVVEAGEAVDRIKVILHPASAQKSSKQQSTQKKAVRKESMHAR